MSGISADIVESYEIPQSYEIVDEVAGVQDSWFVDWPIEWREQAKSVAFCESRWHPESTNGVMLGLFQLSDTQQGWVGWWGYFGFDPKRYAEPRYNAQLALLVFEYDLARNQPPWTQWTCKP